MGRHKVRETYDPILSVRAPQDLKEILRKEAAEKGVTLTCHILELIQAGRRHHIRYEALPDHSDVPLR